MRFCNCLKVDGEVPPDCCDELLMISWKADDSLEPAEGSD